MNNNCPNSSMRLETASILVNKAIEAINNGIAKKPNLIWLELTGCSGNIISLLDGADPDFKSLLTNMANFVFDNSLMVSQGEAAMEKLFSAEDYILAVEGAVSTKNNGMYNIIGSFRSEQITAYKIIKELGAKASHVVAVGTCASDGGISAARPNPSISVGIQDLLNRKVIKLPGPSGYEGIIGNNVNYSNMQ